MEKCYHLGVKALLRNTAGQYLILLVNRAKLRNPGDEEYWDIPGGRLQEGDSIKETLRREIEEETGITSCDVGLHLGIFMSNIEIPTDHGTLGLLLSIYEVQTDAEDIQISDEHLEYRWVDKEELLQKLAHKYPAEGLTILATNL